MRTTLTGLLVAGSLLILSGCGGSSNSKLSYSAFSTSANKICSSLNTKANAATSATRAANPASASALKKLLALEEPAVAKIKALSGPSALEAAKNTFVTDVTANAAVVKRAQAAAAAGNQSAYSAAIRELSATSGSTNAEGSKLGAPACATG